jgi:beta-xylosidase
MNRLNNFNRKLNSGKLSNSGLLLLWLVFFLCPEDVSQAQRQSVTISETREINITGENGPELTWISDNGNGTYTNPLFYDEFSDPDIIRVGDDYYLTGTTMHAMPGLPVLHSKDLVNWELLGYACDKLDLGPEYRLEQGRDAYGQGIWAPCIRYHQGTFCIFANVNRYNTQVFTATNPAGPWTHSIMNAGLHDLSVLFDDNGKIYVVWGYDEIRLAELKKDLSGIKPETEQIIVQRGSGAGEGCHFYKINGRYYITSTNYDPVCYQVCLRADKPAGPYEINVMSAEENLGIGTGWRLFDYNGPPFSLTPPRENYAGCIPMHQGGIVQVQSGEWWGLSMMDYNSVGRLTCLSPVTWVDDRPYFGLPGNLKRSPRTWVKPNTGYTSEPGAPYQRNDDFSGPQLNPVWQWNHVPVEDKWSLSKRKGYLRLYALPAASFWRARNSLTQRAVGPESSATAEIETGGMKTGDVAGLALLNLPYAWIAISKSANGLEIQQYDQQTEQVDHQETEASRIWLRVHCNFDTEIAEFSYSKDGLQFKKLGVDYIMVYQLKTFQGVRFALFNFNTNGKEGGYADFDNFTVYEPRPHGLTRPIPYGKTITLTSIADSTILVNWKNSLRPVSHSSTLARGDVSHFRVLDRGNGRIALQSAADNGFVNVKGTGEMAEIRIEREEKGDASVFQWQDMLQGDLMLMSLSTHRYLFADPFAGSLCSADSPGARPDRKGGSCFAWELVSE